MLATSSSTASGLVCSGDSRRLSSTLPLPTLCRSTETVPVGPAPRDGEHEAGRLRPRCLAVRRVLVARSAPACRIRRAPRGNGALRRRPPGRRRGHDADGRQRVHHRPAPRPQASAWARRALSRYRRRRSARCDRRTPSAALQRAPTRPKAAGPGRARRRPRQRRAAVGCPCLGCAPRPGSAASSPGRAARPAFGPAFS